MKLVLAAWLFSALLGADPKTPAKGPQFPPEPVSQIMAKLSWDETDAYYGTAILFRVTESHLYFITNAHVLPLDQSKWRRLHLTGYLTRFQRRPLQVIGSAPGYDIAVIALAASQVDMGLAKQNLPDERFDVRALDKTASRIGILGIPGFSPEERQFFRNQIWAQEFNAFARWEIPKELTTNPVSAFQLSPAAFTIPSKTTCPPVFLTRCYHVPIRSWGFSGGGFITASTDAKQEGAVKISGIISHFSPLSEITYVIPTAEALEVANRLMRRAAGRIGPIVETRDTSETFELRDLHSARILKGPLFGHSVRQISARDSIGGGESSGGGGESSGGGGESRRPLFLMDGGGNLAGLASYKDLEETKIREPGKWHEDGHPVGFLFGTSPSFKGMDAVLRYRPGIWVEEQKKQYHRYGNRPLIHLQSFVHAYLENSKEKLHAGITKAEIPKFMGIAKNNAGVTSLAYLNKWLEGEDLQKVLTLRNPHASVTRHELAMVLMRARVQGHIEKTPVDVVSSRAFPFGSGTILRASVERGGGRYRVAFIAPRFGKYIVDFPDAFQQQGDLYFQYRGPMTYSVPVPPKVTARVDHSWGVATLQRNPETDLFELKIALAYLVPHDWMDAEWREDNPFFSPRHELGLAALYLPLEPLADPRPVNLTREEENALEAYSKQVEEQRILQRRQVEAAAAENAKTAPDREAQAKAMNTLVSELNQVVLHLSRSYLDAGARRELDELHENIQRLDRNLRRLEEMLGLPNPPVLQAIPHEMVREFTRRIGRIEFRAQLLTQQPETWNRARRLQDFEEKEAFQTTTLNFLANEFLYATTHWNQPMPWMQRAMPHLAKEATEKAK